MTRRLHDHGYAQEEWIATGEQDGHPYATAVCVRRPWDASRFSGTVIVEPLHVLRHHADLAVQRCLPSCVRACVRPRPGGDHLPEDHARPARQAVQRGAIRLPTHQGSGLRRTSTCP
ncbi:alpha/beta hydrolase domain-containing protein [Parafrankia sp. EAN1pec]|uniref:alpha/beta hydrolase domain-containing protein n=1 Tax=Parafrankia sp. (strain EAN1pec) TaxID=298653 RepID=UPI00321AC45A